MHTTRNGAATYDCTSPSLKNNMQYGIATQRAVADYSWHNEPPQVDPMVSYYVMSHHTTSNRFTSHSIGSHEITAKRERHSFHLAVHCLEIDQQIRRCPQGSKDLRFPCVNGGHLHGRKLCRHAIVQPLLEPGISSRGEDVQFVRNFNIKARHNGFDKERVGGDTFKRADMHDTRVNVVVDISSYR